MMSAITAPSASAPFIASCESYLSSALPFGISTLPSDAALHHISTPVLSKLRNLGPSRVKDMRAAGVAMQVVSHIPIMANPQTCAKINDALYTAICLSPDRFAALALLPVGDAKEAARELQRCVTKYRFVGGVLGINGTGRAEDGVGIVIDSPEFEDLWAVAERYRVPIAVREVFPTGEQVSEYQGNFPDALLSPLLTTFHAAHNTSPLPILRLYAAGTFDRHPNLRLILPSSGLALATLLPRIESVFSLPAAHAIHRSFMDVWQHNFYVGTADMLDMATMRALLERIPVDRVLFSGNYPFEERGRVLMDELRDSGLVAREEWERIAWRNAEALFGLRSAQGKASGGRG